MKLYVTRHGETQWNAERRVCGRSDIPLNDHGRDQARELAEKVKSLNLDLIISSPLIRAVETANIVAGACSIPVVIDERIIEQNYGIFEGTDWNGEDFLNNKRQFAFRYPGGESMMILAHRIYGFLEDIRKKYYDKTALVVCHGGVLRVLNTYFEDITNDDFFHYKYPNCAVKEYNL